MHVSTLQINDSGAAIFGPDLKVYHMQGKGERKGEKKESLTPHTVSHLREVCHPLYQDWRSEQVLNCCQYVNKHAESKTTQGV